MKHKSSTRGMHLCIVWRADLSCSSVCCSLLLACAVCASPPWRWTVAAAAAAAAAVQRLMAPAEGDDRTHDRSAVTHFPVLFARTLCFHRCCYCRCWLARCASAARRQRDTALALPPRWLCCALTLSSPCCASLLCPSPLPLPR